MANNIYIKDTKKGISRPSLKANKFISQKMAKLGVVSTPEKILEGVENKKSFWLPEELNLLGRRLYSRPDMFNVQGLFNMIKREDEAWLCPFVGAEFLASLSEDELEDTNVYLSGIDTSEVYMVWAETLLKPFVPLATERLLKLFGMLYHKKLTKEKNFFVSKAQMCLLDTEEGRFEEFASFDYTKLLSIVEEVEKSQSLNTSDTLFNKIKEDITLLQWYLDDKKTEIKKEDGVLALFASEDLLLKKEEEIEAILTGDCEDTEEAA